MDFPTRKPGDEEKLLTLQRIFASEDLMPMVLSFTSILEHLYLMRVNRHWRLMIHRSWRNSWRHARGTLFLDQFWCRLGVLDSDIFYRMFSRMDRIEHLSLGFCCHLNDNLLRHIWHHLIQRQREHGLPLRSLNLFYCYRLSDQVLAEIPSAFPSLTELNLGRCTNLTDRTIRLIAAMPNLKKFNLASIPAVDEHTFMVFDDPHAFPALQLWDIQNTNNDLAKYVVELQHHRPGLKVIGPRLERVEFPKVAKPTED